MKFRSPTGLDMPIALTNGHTTVIAAEGSEVPAMFHKEAVARGAILIVAEEVATTDAPAAAAPASPAGATPDRAQLIQAALQSMLDGGDEGDFTAEGKPNLVKVKAHLGFAVTREEVDAAWAIVSDND